MAAAIFKDQIYSMMNMQKVDVVAAGESKAIVMFKLPGGDVAAQGRWQPDRKKTSPVMEHWSVKKSAPSKGEKVKPKQKTV